MFFTLIHGSAIQHFILNFAVKLESCGSNAAFRLGG